MIYVADFAKNGGIHVYDFSNGKLAEKQYAALDRPMYLCLAENRLYCILLEPFSDSNSGIIHFDVDDSGMLRDQSEIISTEGAVSCHLCVKDENVYSANYASGSVNELGVKTVVHTGKGVHPTRQEAPHTHFTRVSPDGKYILVCDLGLDTIFTYDNGLKEISRVKLPDGSGVRHLEYSADGKTVYSADELSSTISVFDYEDGKLNYITSVNGLPDGFENENAAAAIKRDGDLLYISQRGLNGICVFDIRNKIPQYVSSFSSGGISPRDFSIIGDYIIVTNESGNVAVFNKANYALTDEIKLNSPLCVIGGN